MPKATLPLIDLLAGLVNAKTTDVFEGIKNNFDQQQQAICAAEKDRIILDESFEPLNIMFDARQRLDVSRLKIAECEKQNIVLKEQLTAAMEFYRLYTRVKESRRMQEKLGALYDANKKTR